MTINVRSLVEVACILGDAVIELAAAGLAFVIGPADPVADINEESPA